MNPDVGARRRRFEPGGWLLLGALAGLGCGGTGEVSGTVKFQGRPLASGSVLMMGADNRPLYGEIHEDGSYRIKGVPTGTVKVAVNSPPPTLAPQAPGAEGRSKAPEPASRTPDPAADPKGLWFAIPEKYGDPLTSGLSREIKKGPNTYDIDLD
jgi:hypothetical protein